MARVVPEPCGIPLVDGRTVTARAGDYRIYHGKDTLDVISPARFAVEFEVIDPLALQLTVADCNKLDEILGIAATKDGASLVRACDRLGSIRIGDIRIPFTPGQLNELQYRAQKRGRTVEAELRAVVARIQDEIFHRGPSPLAAAGSTGD